jgi:hypothetical protein
VIPTPLHRTIFVRDFAALTRPVNASVTAQGRLVTLMVKKES